MRNTQIGKQGAMKQNDLHGAASCFIWEPRDEQNTGKRCVGCVEVEWLWEYRISTQKGEPESQEPDHDKLY